MTEENEEEEEEEVVGRGLQIRECGRQPCGLSTEDGCS